MTLNEMIQASKERNEAHMKIIADIMAANKYHKMPDDMYKEIISSETKKCAYYDSITKLLKELKEYRENDTRSYRFEKKFTYSHSLISDACYNKEQAFYLADKEWEENKNRRDKIEIFRIIRFDDNISSEVPNKKIVVKDYLKERI